MIRILVFIVFVLGLGLLFSWLADNPGNVVFTLGGQPYEVSLSTAIAGLLAIIGVVMFTWWLVRSLINSPYMFANWRKGRRKDRGYKAVSSGLIAAGAGDAVLARKLAKESGKLLTNEPLVGLLDAQTDMLEGNREGARKKFETMLEEEDTRLLGLRGLYLEAEREGAKDAASHYAEKATELAPGIAWAGNAVLRNQSAAGDWEAALHTLDRNKSAKLVSKVEGNRMRAVLLTGCAMQMENEDPDKARSYALQAHKLAPELVPAAVMASRLSARTGDLRKASKVVETTWKKSPHPDLADAYVHARPGDSASDRMKRAKALAALRTNHEEGSFAIAKAAMEADNWEEARSALQGVLRNNPSERACLLMADIEEGEHGDRGRVRDWLARAVRAPRDPAWTADGVTSEHWAPISPVSGKLDAFEWKVPVQSLAAPVENADYSDVPTGPLTMVPASSASATAAAAVGATVATAASDDDLEDADVEVDETKTGFERADDVIDIETDEVAEKAEAAADGIEDAVSNGKTEVSKTVSDVDKTLKAAGDESKFKIGQRPDDPGVRSEAAAAADKKRFKLF